MNKDEIRNAVKSAKTKPEVEVILEVVVEKLQSPRIGKKLKETLKIYEEELLDKLDKLEKEEDAKEGMTLKEGEFITVRETSKYRKDVINIFKIVAVTDVEIVIQDLSEYIGLHIILKVEEQKLPYLQNRKISFSGTIEEIMDELK